MLRNIVFLALALAIVSAVEDKALAEALDTINLMKSQGLGANECKALADASLTSVSDAKATSQKLFDSLSTGSECAQSGETEVAAAKKSLDDATDAASNAKSAFDKANAVVPAVEIPSFSALRGMGESCGFIYNSDAFKNGNAAVTTAHDTKTKADALVVSSESALKAAKDAATTKANECRCKVKTALESAWAIESNPTTVAAQKSEWDNSQNLLCALSAKSPCNAPAVPTVVKPTLSADTNAQVCAACASSNLRGLWNSGPRVAFSGFIGSDCKGFMKFPDDKDHPDAYTLEYDASAGAIYWDGRSSRNRWQKDADWSQGITGKYGYGGQTILSVP